MSAQAYGCIPKVARMIADVEGADSAMGQHVAEAVQYRTLEQRSWVCVGHR